jgi:hypothetical protein
MYSALTLGLDEHMSRLLQQFDERKKVEANPWPIDQLLPIFVSPSGLCQDDASVGVVCFEAVDSVDTSIRVFIPG